MRSSACKMLGSSQGTFPYSPLGKMAPSKHNGPGLAPVDFACAPGECTKYGSSSQAKLYELNDYIQVLLILALHRIAKAANSKRHTLHLLGRAQLGQ